MADGSANCSKLLLSAFPHPQKISFGVQHGLEGAIKEGDAPPTSKKEHVGFFPKGGTEKTNLYCFTKYINLINK